MIRSKSPNIFVPCPVCGGSGLIFEFWDEEKPAPLMCTGRCFCCEGSRFIQSDDLIRAEMAAEAFADFQRDALRRQKDSQEMRETGSLPEPFR